LDGRAWVATPRAETRVVRGGSFWVEIDSLLAAYRLNQEPGSIDYHYGFRCARDAD
jgi:formylglycine-generating enzyme required for sulfatase activity